MKIAFAGVGGVGKTTLLGEMKKWDFFKDYEFRSGVSRQLLDMGLNINQAGNDETQLALIDIHKKNLEYPKIVMDRCMLDATSYGTHQHSTCQVNANTLIKMINALYDTIEEYDHIFYIEPEFPAPEDGVRVTDEEYRHDVDNVYKLYIDLCKQLRPACTIHQLTGSVEERLNQIKKILRIEGV